MAISQLTNPVFTSVLTSDGSANAGGYIYVLTVGGSYADPNDHVTVWSDKAKTTPIPQPIDLNEAGQAEIWFDGTVDIVIFSAADALLDTITGVQSSPTVSVSGEFNLLKNGSFEIDTDGDGSPDNWTLSPEADAVISVDSNTGYQTHGTYSLHFDASSGTAGGGTALSDMFSVRDGNGLTVSWDFMQANAATGTYKVELIYYDSTGTLVGTDEVWSSISGAPTSWTNYSNPATAPVVDSGATQARLQLTGLANGGADETGECWFDNISVIDPLGLVTLTGTQELTNKTLTSPTIDGATINGGTVISGTAVATTSGTEHDFTVPSWVKKITVMFNGVSVSGTDELAIELGDSVGVETTGYYSKCFEVNAATLTVTYTGGFNIVVGTSAALLYTGQVFINLIDTNTWVSTGQISSDAGYLCLSTGVKTLSDTITTVRVTTLGGANTFDAGQVNILYEG